MKILKNIFQIFIFILEMAFVIGILTKISLILFPLEIIFSWQLIERIIGLYTVYQIFIFATLTQIDDAEKDSYNTLKFLCEETLLYFKINKNNVEYRTYFYYILLKSIYFQQSSQIMNSEYFIEEYRNLSKFIIYENNIGVENIIISCNHALNHLDLKFTKSIFLRKFKNPSFKVKWKILTIFSCIVILYFLYAVI